MPRPAAPADPLADLREPDAPVEPPRPVPGSTADTEQGRLAAIITAWHADPTASSFGHGGGTCGCRYLAAMALAALES